MRRLLPLLCLLFSLSSWALENQLAGSGSPYLEMHAGDPVHWQRWSRAVLDEARREGKPIFISSGYFACHWCHVMQRESYRNPEIAALLNDHFIPVKVDRELDPALDAHLIDFVQRTQGSAGWPLNVLLTPEGYPLVGFTYLPPQRFAEVLKKFSDLWQQQRGELTAMAKRALDELVSVRREEASDIGVQNDRPLRERFIDAAMADADEISGGFGQQSRFPMQPQLHALLVLAGGGRRPAVDDFVKLTLRQMARRGLRDQLDGGFFRYTMDPGWRRPHYEKMLYTQALMALLYLEASRRYGEPRWRELAFDTLDFVLRRMKGKEGGYVASFSAVDDQGVEGGYYLWRREELEKLFPPETLKLVLRHWHFQGLENDEPALPLAGETVAELARSTGVTKKEMAARVARWRARLLAARDRRGLPVDHKQLAGWNGLLLAALAEAVQAPGGERFRAPAEKLYHYLAERHWDGKVLWRTPAGQGQRQPGALDDYAYVAWGMDRWAAAGGDAAARTLSVRLVAQAWQRFHDENGWHLGSEAILPGMPAAEAQEDGALPSPAARLLALWLRSTRRDERERARKLLLRARPQVQREPFWYPSYVLLLVRYSGSPSGRGKG